MNRLKKIFKKVIMSVAICFPLVFTFNMILSIGGVSIGLGIFSLALGVPSIVLTWMYDISELKKILKRFVISVAICFSLTFTLMMVNAAMGLFMELGFYLLLFAVLTIGFTIALVLFDSNVIFSSKKAKQQIKRKPVTNKTKKVESHSKVRRKIS